MLFGLSSITCHGHCIHIAYPANGFLDAAIDPVVIPCLEDLLLKDCPEMLFGYPHVNESLGFSGLNESSITERLLNHQTPQANELAIPYLSHPSLSINLLFPASNSILFGHHIYALPIYPYVRPDLLTVLCLVFRSWRFLIIGAFTRATNSWLIYLGIALGLHSFSLYIHNDTLEPFEREEDMFRDNGIQLKPVFAISYQSCLRILSLDIKMSCLHKKVILMPLGRGDITICVILMSVELGTGDFIVYHIHAFTIHIALLICMIGLIYPCDGPGRGEDQLYLAVVSVVL